jgi:exopolyphosphatase/pppGpp-phosphohydrolase
MPATTPTNNITPQKENTVTFKQLMALLRIAESAAERAALPFMHPGRVEVIGAGSLILQAVLEAAGAAEVITSEADLLDGIAFRLAGG